MQGLLAGQEGPRHLGVAVAAPDEHACRDLAEAELLCEAARLPVRARTDRPDALVTCTTTVRAVSDGARLREEFLLDPSVTFLNHGSFGATPRAVFERYQEWQLELERQPVLFRPAGWIGCWRSEVRRCYGR